MKSSSSVVQRRGTDPIVFGCLLAIGLGFAPRADAKVHNIKHETFTGIAVFDDDKMEGSCTTWLDVDIAVAASRLSDWKASASLVKNLKAAEVRTKRSDGARIFIERETPFFLPSMEMLIDATLSERDDGTWLLQWRQVEGLAKKFEKRWVLTPVDGGTRFDIEFKIHMPFSPPAFMVDNPRDEMAADVLRLRKLVGATHARPPPATRQKAVIEAPAHPTMPTHPTLSAPPATVQ